MSWLSGLLATGKAALTGVNWSVWVYKIALYVAIAASLYGAGVLNTKRHYAEAEAQRSEERAEQIVKVVEKRIPVIQVQEKVRTETEYKTRTIYEKLKAENDNAPARPECKLSPDELRYYGEVAELTRVR